MLSLKFISNGIKSRAIRRVAATLSAMIYLGGTRISKIIFCYIGT